MDGMNYGNMGQFYNVPDPVDYKAEKKNCSKIAFVYVAMFIIVSGFQFGLSYLFQYCCPQIITDYYWLFFMIVMIPTYAIGYPLVAFFMGKGEKVQIERRVLNAGDYTIFICMTFCLLIAGSLLGTGTNDVISYFTGIDIQDSLSEIFDNSTLLVNILVAGIAAPVFEELMFRKLLIDKMVRYGEGVAILVSGFAFGLFHGNFGQFFYAAAIGVLFGFIYVKTGKIGYTISLHMIVNLSSALMVPVYNRIDYDLLNSIEGISDILNPAKMQALMNMELWPIIVLLVYNGIVYSAAIVGFFMFIFKWKRMSLDEGSVKLGVGRKFSTVFLNPGAIIYVVLMIAMFVYNILLYA